MANLRSHKIIGEIEYLRKRVAYGLDGVILENTGDGWRIDSRFKPGVDVPAKVSILCERARELRRRPPYAALWDALNSITTSLEKRRAIIDHISPPNGFDPIYSTLEELERFKGVKITPAQVENLKVLYSAYQEDLKLYKAERE